MGKMKKIRVYAVITMVCTAVGVAYFIGQHQSRPRVVSGENTESMADDFVESSSFPEVQIDPIRKKIRAAEAEGKHLDPFPALARTREGLPLEGDPFGPASVQEQRWLDRNGYPTAERWVAYSGASDAVLQQAAEAGDEAARVMLGIRHLEDGNPEARDDLLASAVRGSGFALDAYSTFLAGSKSQGDPAAAYVLSRVAEMRGDHRQAVFREFFLKRQPTQQQRLRWGAEALTLYDSMQLLHKELYGESSSWVDSRPVGD